MSNSLTISGLSLKIFLNNYYDNNIPHINKKSMYGDIKQAYYGGITEVYIPVGDNLNQYDYNSMYPYVSSNDMPGLVCVKIHYFHSHENINNFFGFFFIVK